MNRSSLPESLSHSTNTRRCCHTFHRNAQFPKKWFNALLDSSLDDPQWCPCSTLALPWGQHQLLWAPLAWIHFKSKYCCPSTKGIEQNKTLTYSARLCSWLDWVPAHPQWVLKPSQISHQTSTLPWQQPMSERSHIWEQSKKTWRSRRHPWIGRCMLFEPPDSARRPEFPLKKGWVSKTFAKRPPTCGKGVTSAHSGLSE